MSQKKKKIKPKQAKFLMLYAETSNLADSYIQAGYKPGSRASASECGRQLLRRLEDSLDYKEILASRGVDEGYIAEKIKELLDCDDKHVKARVLAFLTKCVGWQKDELDVPQGVEIVIMRRHGKVDPENVVDPSRKGQLPMKPITIKE